MKKEQAQEFWRDLMGTLWGNPNRDFSSGIMSEELIADYMNMPVGKATEFLRACAKFKITERQGGAWVV